MTNGVFERSQLSKVFARLSKRGDDDVKALTKRITENANVASRKQQGESVDAKKSSSNQAAIVKAAPAFDKKPASPVTGIKRQRELEADVKQPTKKLASDKAPLRGAASQINKAPLTKSTSDTKTASPATAQTTKKVIPKTTSSIFSSLTPAYKKAGASSQVRITGTDASQPSRPTSTSLTTQAKSGGFSFADAMASLTKAKEPESEVKQESSLPPESLEERKKRLRKEARRKLRVSFKPESELREIRHFEHDPEEEFGHDEAQSRDVKSHQSEGQMLKLHLDPDAMDLDDDDDEDEQMADAGEPEREFRPPPEIDFSDLPDDARSGLYFPYGGGRLIAESPEREAQRQREANTLLAVYASREDIPASPREPFDVEMESNDPNTFGEPPSKIADLVAKYETQEKERQALLAQQAVTVPLDLSSLLAKIQQPQQAPMQQNQPPPNMNFQDILARLQQPQSQQPPQSQNWQYNPMQNYQQQQYPYQQQPGWANSGWNPQQQQAPMQQQQQPSQDLASILASLQSGGPSSAAQMPQYPAPGLNPNMQFPNMGAGAQGMPNMGGPAQQAQQANAAPFENEERRQMREQQEYQQQHQNQNAGRPAPYKVVVCKYWKEGKCLKGEHCTFKHED